MTTASLKDVIFADVAMLTIKSVETRAVRDCLAKANIPVTSVVNTPHFCMESFLIGPADKGQIRCVLVAGADDQGPERAAVFTMSALHKLRPAAVLMVGMCAGLKDIALGDVAVILGAFPRDEGLLDEEGIFQSDGRKLEACKLARQMANSIPKTLQGLEKVDPAAARDPCVKVVETVSGAAVVEGAKFVRTDMSRRIATYEMESSAFYTAVNDYNSAMQPHERKCSNLGVYKGVSDMADSANRVGSDKATKQFVAASNAFKAVLAGLEHHAITQLIRSRGLATNGDAYVYASLEQDMWKEVKDAHGEKLKQHLLSIEDEAKRYVHIDLPGFKYVCVDPQANPIKKYSAQAIIDLLKEDKIDIPQCLSKLAAEDALEVESKPKRMALSVKKTQPKGRKRTSGGGDDGASVTSKRSRVDDLDEEGTA